MSYGPLRVIICVCVLVCVRGVIVVLINLSRPSNLRAKYKANTIAITGRSLKVGNTFWRATPRVANYVAQNILCVCIVFLYASIFLLYRPAAQQISLRKETKSEGVRERESDVLLRQAAQATKTTTSFNIAI